MQRKQTPVETDTILQVLKEFPPDLKRYLAKEKTADPVGTPEWPIQKAVSARGEAIRCRFFTVAVR